MKKLKKYQENKEKTFFRIKRSCCAKKRTVYAISLYSILLLLFYVFHSLEMF